MTLEAAAKLIGVCNMTALRMLRRGEIKARRACTGAPWVIKAEDVAGFKKQSLHADASGEPKVSLALPRLACRWQLDVKH